MQGIFWQGNIESNFVGHQMAEVYKDQIYRRFLDGKHGLTIVDLGANIGITSQYFAKFAKRVVSVEPSIEHFEALTQMIQFNNLENITPVKVAIGINNGVAKFYKNETNKSMFSLREAANSRNVSPIPPENVSCITIDKLFADNGIDHCDFMKMDIEGSEAEVLAHTSFGKVADKIDAMVVELHAWSGRHPNQTVEALKEQGFNVKTIAGDAQLIAATK